VALDGQLDQVADERLALMHEEARELLRSQPFIQSPVAGQKPQVEQADV
jgi:hypothetical protein